MVHVLREDISTRRLMIQFLFRQRDCISAVIVTPDGELLSPDNSDSVVRAFLQSVSIRIA